MKTIAHGKCRPPKGAESTVPFPNKSISARVLVWRLGDDGKWKRDDGTPGLAFIGSLDGENRIWVASCKCIGVLKCPRMRALEHAREKLDIESISVVERPRKGGTLR